MKHIRTAPDGYNVWMADGDAEAGAEAERIAGPGCARYTTAALAAHYGRLVTPTIIVRGSLAYEVIAVDDGKPGRTLAVIYYRGGVMPSLSVSMV